MNQIPMNQIIINTCTTGNNYTDTFPQTFPEIPAGTAGETISCRLDGETRERLIAYAKLEHLALPVFFRSLIDCGLKTYEYQGGF